jgi:hypothetical protein
MRRIVPLLVVAACPLVPVLAGCDDGSSASDTSSTIAVGTLAESVPSSLSVADDTSETSATTERSAPSTAAAGPTTTAPPTRFAEVLGAIADGEPVDAPPTDMVVDDTHRLRMELPKAWSDRRTASPLEGEEAPYIAAAPDQTKFLDGYGEPGLTAVVVDAAPAEALDAYSFDDCAGDGRSRFSSSRLAGLYEVWQDCGETGNAIVTIAVRQGRDPGTVLVLAQIVEPADLAALDQAMATLRLTR